MYYPIGVQSFEKIREADCVYVDKTSLVYRLTHEFQFVFLARPRRFGKSLLLSTIDAYFQGKKHLFEGLAIECLEKDWEKHAVIHIDLNNAPYDSVDGLIEYINDQLRDYEIIYGRNPDSDLPQLRLRWLIKSAKEQTGNDVVILIDEYDKPVLNALGEHELDIAIRKILKPFYGILKSEGEHIRFAMITGVSKFGKLSVFSDLNNIKDISMLPSYATICGITTQEILDNFSMPIASFAKSKGIGIDEMIQMLRKKYDGYRFSSAKDLVFNPYSLLNALNDQSFDDYWFDTGTPTFLIRLLQKNKYDIAKIEGTVADASSLYMPDNVSAIPLLYQSGYLTIKDYNERRRVYTLGYPNEEVEMAFFNFLMPFYSKFRTVSESKAEVFDLIDEINASQVDAFMERIKGIFLGIPYAKDNSMKMQEDQFRNLMYLLFKLVGSEINVECPMSKGRTDAIIKTGDNIYVMEFKVDKSPEQALAQIYEKGYAEPFRRDPRPVTLIGINYSTTDRAITGWVQASLPPCAGVTTQRMRL